MFWSHTRGVTGLLLGFPRLRPSALGKEAGLAGRVYEAPDPPPQTQTAEQRDGRWKRNVYRTTARCWSRVVAEECVRLLQGAFGIAPKSEYVLLPARAVLPERAAGSGQMLQDGCSTLADSCASERLTEHARVEIAEALQCSSCQNYLNV